MYIYINRKRKVKEKEVDLWVSADGNKKRPHKWKS